jgi:hypothetical protein
VLPVALLLGELVARTLELAAPREAYDYLTLVPALLGAGVGFLAVLASFVLAPPLRGRWRLDAVRLLQVATWAFGTFMMLGAMGSV